MTRKVIGKDFFRRDTRAVARELLGKFLVRKAYGEEIAAMITETEAYDGPKDKASHAHRGRTARNAPMFGSAGVWYVYLCYGMHNMLNIVTGEKKYPAAVLIRGVEGALGPGRVTKMFRIGREYNCAEAHPKTGLWIEDRGVKIRKGEIAAAPRVGVAYAGPVWSKKHYRFFIK